jgi:glutaredoxin-like protein NrdH
MRRITLYSLSTCGVCKKVRKFLEEHQIEHLDIEVDTLDSGEQWLATKELTTRNPKASYPTLVIEDMVLGFDQDQLAEKLLGMNR